MSIQINELGLKALFEGRAIENIVQKKAEEVVENAKENITEKVMARVGFRDQIAANVGYKMEGTTAIIGIRESGERAPFEVKNLLGYAMSWPAGGEMTPTIGWKRGHKPGSGAERKKSREQYLAEKEVKEGGVWLLPALQKTFSIGGV